MVSAARILAGHYLRAKSAGLVSAMLEMRDGRGELIWSDLLSIGMPERPAQAGLSRGPGERAGGAATVRGQADIRGLATA